MIDLDAGDLWKSYQKFDIMICIWSATQEYLILNQSTSDLINCGPFLLLESQYEQNILWKADCGWLAAPTLRRTERK